jgi:hypothetical protein
MGTIAPCGVDAPSGGRSDGGRNDVTVVSVSLP